MLSEGDRVTLRATPLDQTSIRTGGRKREPNKSRLARRAHHRLLHAAGHGRRGPPGAGRSSGGASGKDLSLSRESASERRRKTSLFRRLSSKRASAEIQQQVSRSAPEFFFPFFNSFSLSTVHVMFVHSFSSTNWLSFNLNLTILHFFFHFCRPRCAVVQTAEPSVGTDSTARLC